MALEDSCGRHSSNSSRIEPIFFGDLPSVFIDKTQCSTGKDCFFSIKFVYLGIPFGHARSVAKSNIGIGIC